MPIDTRTELQRRSDTFIPRMLESLGYVCVVLPTPEEDAGAFGRERIWWVTPEIAARYREVLALDFNAGEPE